MFVFMLSQDLFGGELLLTILAHKAQEPEMLDLDVPFKVWLLVVAAVAP
jgi:hypothetical protein